MGIMGDVLIKEVGPIVSQYVRLSDGIKLIS